MLACDNQVVCADSSSLLQDDAENEWKKMQLRELALMNGAKLLRWGALRGCKTFLRQVHSETTSGAGAWRASTAVVTLFWMERMHHGKQLTSFVVFVVKK